MGSGASTSSSPGLSTNSSAKSTSKSSAVNKITNVLNISVSYELPACKKCGICKVCKDWENVSKILPTILNNNGKLSADEVLSSIYDDMEKFVRKIDLIKCPSVTDESLDKISSFKNLSYLDISNVKNINDKFIIAVANNCKIIRNLYIESSKNVSRSALNELGKLKYVKTLCLVDMDNVGDDIFINMPLLEVLRCTWCPNVTDVGMMRVIKNAPRLERLMICNTGTTSKTLVYAADETKKRTNNIILRLTTNKKIYQDYKDLQHDSGRFVFMSGLDMCCKSC